MSRLANRFRHLAPGALLLIAAFAPLDAQAQLRGLGGSGPGIGSIGALGSGSAPVASPGFPSAPTGSVGSDLRSPLPGATSTIPGSPNGRNTVTNSVTNTLNGDVTAPIANTAGRARTALGDTVNRIGENAGIARTAAQGRSRVPPAGELRFVSNEVLVGLPSNLTPQALDTLARRYGLIRLESQRIGLTGTTFHRWQISDQRSVADVIRGLEADGGVSMAQPNYRFTLQQDQAAPAAGRGDAAQYALEKLHILQAHQLATGGQVLIAVIDGGIDASHPEIAGDIAESFDALDAEKSPSVHGTAMAGAIVAHARLMGVAPSARILAIRAFGASGGGDESTTLAVLKSIDWAVAHRARVINMSFAGPQDPEIARSLAAAYRKGVVLVAAAGNGGPKSAPLYPAADPNVIAVTATDSADHLLAQANRGRYIAVAAPGVDILAPAPGNAYQLTTGTSVAAAEVSGLVALLLEAKANLTPQAVRKILMSSARALGPKGPDDQFGAGLADANRALLSLTATVARAPTTSASVAH